MSHNSPTPTAQHQLTRLPSTYQFAGLPAWNASPYYTSPRVIVYNNSGQNINSLSSVKSWAQAQCGQAGFTGGPQTVVQYMWGNYNGTWYQTNLAPAIPGRDFDYVCQQIGSSGPPSISLLSGNGAMASTMRINGLNFGTSQSSSFVHLWFTPDNSHSCATDSSTINWGEPGNEAAFSVTGWSNTAISFQVPTPSGPNRRIGSNLGGNLWLIPAGDTACLTVTTSGGTTGTASFTRPEPGDAELNLVRLHGRFRRSRGLRLPRRQPWPGQQRRAGLLRSRRAGAPGPAGVQLPGVGSRGHRRLLLLGLGR